MTAPDVVIILTTWPASKDAAPFVSVLIEEHLAACVNVLPEMDSVYRWRGHVERDRERQVVIKTTRDRMTALFERVKSLHPYEVPEWLVVSIAGGSEAYLSWVGESVAGTD
jgi:periplasmic divalent cation tolerance protein